MFIFVNNSSKYSDSKKSIIFFFRYYSQSTKKYTFGIDNERSVDRSTKVPRVLLEIDRKAANDTFHTTLRPIVDWITTQRIRSRSRNSSRNRRCWASPHSIRLLAPYPCNLCSRIGRSDSTTVVAKFETSRHQRASEKSSGHLEVILRHSLVIILSRLKIYRDITFEWSCLMKNYILPSTYYSFNLFAYSLSLFRVKNIIYFQVR